MHAYATLRETRCFQGSQTAIANSCGFCQGGCVVRPTARQRERHARLVAFDAAYWEKGLFLAGLDEAGAGPWAGPVTAACVVLDGTKEDQLIGVYDSKAILEGRRLYWAENIEALALAFAVVHVEPDEIDRINIRQAGILAMERAFEAVFASHPVDQLVVDARHLPSVSLPQESLVKGDQTSLSIAAASILAKVARDARMEAEDARYPGYGFARHKGYGTALHLAQLEALGPCPIHRKSFAPVRKFTQSDPFCSR